MSEAEEEKLARDFLGEKNRDAIWKKKTAKRQVVYVSNTFEMCERVLR